MDYIGIVIIIVATIVGIILHKKQRKSVTVPSDNNVISTNGTGALEKACQPEELVIKMEMLPAEAIEDESKLVEIKDSKVLASVNNLIPG